MRKYKALFCSGFWLFTGPSAYSATQASATIFDAKDVGSYLAACRADEGGCEAEVLDALMDKMSFSVASNICLDTQEFAKPAIEWLKAHPETRAMPTEDGIFLSLKTNFPCD